MQKMPMYIIISLASGIGSYIPILFGQSMLDIWSILGGFVGGIVGIIIYLKLRQAGYIE